MKALVDTNIFLDVFLDREGLADGSQAVLDFMEAHPGEGWIAWHTFANLYYIGAKLAGRRRTLQEIDAILDVFEVCPAGTAEAKAARLLRIPDFEDALQIAAAQSAGAERIITRNTRDFASSPVPAVSPEAFLR
ncbi:MAG: type II toxin-antitoxin system VapC family toxin [Oceanipulchritudo sp.]